MKLRFLVATVVVIGAVAAICWARSARHSATAVQPVVSVSRAVDGSQLVSLYFSLDGAVPEVRACCDDVRVITSQRLVGIYLRGNVHDLLVKGQRGTTLESPAWNVGASTGLDVVVGDDGGLSFKASH